MADNLPLALQTAMRMPVSAPKNGEFFTPVFRVAFPHLDEPWAGNNKDGNNVPAYSCAGVFSDDASLASLVEVSNRQLTNKFGNDALEMLQHGVYRYPLRPKKVMASKFSGFDGTGYFCSLRARKDAPMQCVAFIDGKPTPLQPGAIERHLYPGSYAYAIIQIYAYDNVGKGVGWGLRTLVKVADGERFGGPKATTQEEALAAITGVMLPPGLIGGSSGGVQLEGKAEPVNPPFAVGPAIPLGDDSLDDFFS